jgi:mannose-1-phosphate guanylyltransferase/mannose-6-phosphate isomerase
MILAGGRGERFWPLSREHRPKPLLDLGLGETLLAATLRRAATLAESRAIRVVASASLARILRRQAGIKGRHAWLVEPAARDTGPAALLATWTAWKEDPGSEVLLLPADHHIAGEAAFRSAVARARRLARAGYLVVFGVVPVRPDSEFGYLVPGRPLGRGAFEVRRFVEKPSRARAQALIRKGSALWNSGMFLWRADTFLHEASRWEPRFAAWLQNQKKPRTGGAARRSFLSLPRISVDRAVMEKSRRVAVIPARFGWSDLGSWRSLYDLLRRDKAGNAGWGELVALESRGNLAFHPGGLTVLAGVRDLLVVSAGKVLLVCPRSRASAMKHIIKQLREAGHVDHL